MVFHFQVNQQLLNGSHELLEIRNQLANPFSTGQGNPGGYKLFIVGRDINLLIISAYILNLSIFIYGHIGLISQILAYFGNIIGSVNDSSLNIDKSILASRRNIWESRVFFFELLWRLLKDLSLIHLAQLSYFFTILWLMFQVNFGIGIDELRIQSTLDFWPILLVP